MQIGIVDLQGIGAQVARRLLVTGHQCAVFDACPRRLAELAAERAYGAASLADLIHELDPPRSIVLTGAQAPMDETVETLLRHAEPGDVFLDCSESTEVDDQRRSARLLRAQVDYVDVGLCGELARVDRPWCVTVGGAAAVVRPLDRLFRDIADGASKVPGGCVHCGPAGAGHFVASIHNRIVARLLAAYAEGFGVLNAAAAGNHAFNLAAIADAWSKGSLVASEMLDLTARALAKDVVGADISTRLLSALQEECVSAGSA